MEASEIKELEFSCPICDNPKVGYKKTDKIWFGRCLRCRTRFYTDLVIMEVYVDRMVKNASTP